MYLIGSHKVVATQNLQVIPLPCKHGSTAQVQIYNATFKSVMRSPERALRKLTLVPAVQLARRQQPPNQAGMGICPKELNCWILD